MNSATPGKPRRPGSVRSDFETALERLVNGKPNDKTLRERAAKKTLRITIATLALEAGRSRTLIGSDDCRYPDIRAKVEELNSTLCALQMDNVTYLDAGKGLVSEDGRISTDMMPDFLHPTEKAYEVIAQNVEKILKGWFPK